jgi:hypothetical protein
MMACKSREEYHRGREASYNPEAEDTWSQLLENDVKLQAFRKRLDGEANLRLNRLKAGLATLCRTCESDAEQSDGLSAFSDDSRDYAEYDPDQEVMLAIERGEAPKDISMREMMEALSDTSDDTTVISIESQTAPTHNEFYTDPSELRHCALFASHEDTETQLDSDEDTSSNSTIDQEEILRLPSGTVTGERVATLKYIETLGHEEFRYFREDVLEEKHRRIGTQEALDLDRNGRWLEAAQLRASLTHERFLERNTEMRTSHILPGTFFVNVNDDTNCYLICDGITLFRYTVYGFRDTDSRNWFMRNHPIRNGSVFPYNVFDSDEEPIHVSHEAVRVTLKKNVTPLRVKKK